jgi:LacI family transcriptional regulator
MATTIKDIAKMCGVGVSTVSRAINGHPDINPATREKIMKVVEETGFVPNASARSLKQSESNNVALIVKGIANPFFTRMIHVLEDSIEKKGCATILRHVASDQDEVHIAAGLAAERKLKGIIFLGGNFTHDGMQLKNLGVPYVFSTIGMDSDGKDPVIANVSVDDVEAAKMAISYLIESGHRRIGLIAEGIDVPSVGQLRYRGYCEAFKEHGLEIDHRLITQVSDGEEHYTMENGYKAAKILLRTVPDLSAIFCFSDVLAMGACRAITDHGKKIPEDVSVVGFDGIEDAKYFIPRLTTIRQPVDEIARETIDMLFGMIEGKTPGRRVLMQAQLVLGESTANGPFRH